MGTITMAWFPFDSSQSGCSGSLIHSPDHYAPSDHNGTLIYFGCADIDATIQRARNAKAAIVQDKKQISPEHGYMALLLDSEGNRIALYSQK